MLLNANSVFQKSVNFTTATFGFCNHRYNMHAGKKNCSSIGKCGHWTERNSIKYKGNPDYPIPDGQPGYRQSFAV